MSMVRGKLQHKTILNFKGKVSRNRITQALRKMEMREYVETKNGIIIRHNWVQIGMFRVAIVPSALSTENRTRLREYGAFAINIQEAANKQKNDWRMVHPHSDIRFRGQSWVSLMGDWRFRIKNLVDVLYYLGKLDKMRAFL